MKTRNLENRLAYLAALIVLIGVFVAATSAFAAEPAIAAGADQRADETIIGAREAMTEAAIEAAEAIKAENTSELEIQLADLTSTLIAHAK